MLNDWLSPELSRAWIQLIRDEGDVFRRAFIMPVVQSVAAAIKADSQYSSPHAMKEGLERFLCRIGESKNFPCYSPMDNRLLSSIVCLDMGAGEGYLGRWLCRMGAEYLAVDGSPHLFSFGLQAAKSEDLVRYRSWCGDFETFLDVTEPATLKWEPSERGDVDPSKINLIMCHAAIEHISDQKRFLTNLRRWILKNCKQAVFLLTTLSPEFFHRVFLHIPRERTASEPFQARLPIGCTGYNVRANPKELTETIQLLERSGWRVLETVRFETSHYPMFLWNQFALAVGRNDFPEFGPFTSFTAVPTGD